MGGYWYEPGWGTRSAQVTAEGRKGGRTVNTTTVKGDPVMALTQALGKRASLMQRLCAQGYFGLRFEVL